MLGGGPLSKIAELRQQLISIFTFPILSQWKLCHSNQSALAMAIKTIFLYRVLLEKVGNDDGRMTDTCLYYKLTYEASAQVS